MIVVEIKLNYNVREIYKRPEDRFNNSREIEKAIVDFLNEQFKVYLMPYEIKEECGNELYVLDKETNKEIWQVDDEPCDLDAFFDLMNNAILRLVSI